jgi:hypothetical protein
VLSRIFVAKRDEVTGECREIHNERLNDMYSLSNIIRVITSRRMRWVRHIARMEERRGEVHTGFWRENLRVRDHLEDSAVDGRIILRGRGAWTGLIWFRIWTDGGHL